jgi:hypothetical protein
MGQSRGERPARGRSLRAGDAHPMLHQAGLQEAPPDAKEALVADSAREPGPEDVVIRPVESHSWRGKRQGREEAPAAGGSSVGPGDPPPPESPTGCPEASLPSRGQSSPPPLALPDGKNPPVRAHNVLRVAYRLYPIDRPGSWWVERFGPGRGWAYDGRFRMTIGLPRPWPGYPSHPGLLSASCTSFPRFRHQLSRRQNYALSSKPGLRAALPRYTLRG